VLGYRLTTKIANTLIISKKGPKISVLSIIS
jgi:hypothetical protein